MVRSIAASIALAAAALFAHSAHGRDIELLDFTSPNCGPCQQMAPTITSMIEAGYPITRIDVTREPQTAARYKVPRVPTMIMLVEGQVFDRLEGGTTGPTLEQMFQRARAELDRRKTRLQSPDRIPGRTLTQTAQSTPPSVAWSNTQRSTFSPPPSTLQPSTPDSQPSTLNPQLSTLLNASVRLRVDDASGHAFGTGTIIDAREGEALIITCGHLFRETKGQVPPAVEMFEVTAGGVRSVCQVEGKVISYDLERDVALVAIRPGRPVIVAPVAPPRTAIQRGDRVTSVGCSNGQDPTPLASRITTLDRYQGPPNIEATGAPVEGRSGGGLFNQDGQLIGICFAADKEGNEGLYAALRAIHDELNACNLSDVYLPRNLVAANSADLPAEARPAATGPVIRGQNPDPPAPRSPKRELAPPNEVTPATLAITALAAPQPAPANLNPAEQAAWEEIMRRAASAEVICIIRPKQPGGQSEVITLNNVSADFVRALAGRSQPAAPFTR
jgi:S1-C subfamily serine protease